MIKEHSCSPIPGLFPEPEAIGYGLTEFRSGHGPMLPDAGPLPASAFRLTGGGRERGGLVREQLPRGSASFRDLSEDLITGRRSGVDFRQERPADTPLATGSQALIWERFNQGGEGRGLFLRKRPNDLGPADTTPPRVVGAISSSQSTVLVRFSEAMDKSILEPSLYAISLTKNNTSVSSLPVSKVVFDNKERTAVVLKTGGQSDSPYTVRLVGGTDRAGNPFAAPSRFGIDPAVATFLGTPPSGNLLKRDKDRDELSGSLEIKGWEVTVESANGEKTSYLVTSDPGLKDTDGDGLNDADEKKNGFDPRNADTDGDLAQ